MNRKILFIGVVSLALFCLMGSACCEEWSETSPDCIYVEKTQFRFREKEFLESASPSLDGWIQYADLPGDWGAWASNGTTAVAATADREVRTIPYEAVIQVTGYRYKHYRYYNTSNGSVYYTYGTGYADSMGYSGDWETKEVSVSDRLSPYKVYDGVQSYGVAYNFWFYEEEIRTVTTAAYTEYQYRTRPRTYYFFRWLDWSSWQDEPVEPSDNIDVETRTLYKKDTGRLASNIEFGTVNVLPMMPSTGCQIKYVGSVNAGRWISSNPDVVSVDQAGYVSAHETGTAVVSMETGGEGIYSLSVVVKNWEGIKVPTSLVTIENEAFSGGKFEFVDLTTAPVALVYDRAFSDNDNLMLVHLGKQISFGNDVFYGSDQVVLASDGQGSTTDYARSFGIPFYEVGNEMGHVAVSSVDISEIEISLRAGNIHRFTWTVLPQSATDQSVIWSSSNPSVATVTPGGLVSAVSEGTATITVTSQCNPSVKDECIVSVLPVLVDSVTLNRQSTTIFVGQNITLSASVLPDNAKDKSLVWKSTNEGVARVNGNGVVSGISAGSATISAESVDGSGQRGSCIVTVIPAEYVDDSWFVETYVDNVSETNAVIHTKVSLPHNPSLAGYYFGTSSNNLELSATEDSSGMPLNNQIVWYNLNKWGKTLKPGTTYYYQFFIVYDGITYKTSIHSFRTSGTAGVMINDSMFTIVYVDNVTETNAVIHAKVSLPHNPTKAGYYFGTSANALVHSAEEDASNMPLSNQIIWYDLNKWGKTLSPGTTYYYQFYIVYDDVTYKTSVRSFTTQGSIAVSDGNTVSVYEGTTIKIPFTYTPYDASVQWSSSDTSIATVDQQGNVYGVKGGNAVVTVVVSAYGKTSTQQFNISVNGIVRRVLIVGTDYDDKGDSIIVSCLHEIINRGFVLENGVAYYPNQEESRIIAREPVTTAEGVRMCFQRAALDYGTMPEVHLYTNLKKILIQYEIMESFADADDNDINILYLSGHGSESRTAYCTYDSSYIYHGELRNAFDGIKGDNVIILDCRFSGGYIKSGLFTNGRFHILAAAKDTQASRGSCDNFAYTGFGYYVLLGLGWSPNLGTPTIGLRADYNEDNKITLRELYQYVSPKVTKNAQRIDADQDVMYYSSSDVVLIDRN